VRIEEVAGPELAEVEDADLVRAMRSDPVALEEFYRRHVRALTRYAARQLGDEHAADDVVATSFLAAIESAARYDPARAPARAWLFGITGNVIATQYRRAAAERRATLRLSGQRALAVDEFGGLDDAIDAGRLTGPADAVLDLLPAAERELFGLLLDERLTLPEAAAALGIRPGTARMRLARARARLAQHLDARDGGSR
jgi:RNA polymerase sigma factor (sigma-70 family)